MQAKTNSREVDPDSGGHLPQPGELVDGKYLIEGIVGIGGMATVVRARHVVRQAPVALKFLRLEMMDADSHSRFMREGVAASAIPSEHVVKVLDIGRLPNGIPYLVMDLLEGRDLAGLLRAEGTPGLPIPRTVHFILQILRALQAAHMRGIVHRDLKPSNCFVTEHEGEDDFIKVLDFGVSKLRTNQQTALTRAGWLLGTIAYMAPEQVLSSRDADERSDLYSVGVVLYRLLTGRLPYHSSVKDSGKLAVEVVEGTPIPITDVLPSVPNELAETVHKAIARAPAERFASAADMAEALAPWADAASGHFLQRIRSSAKKPRVSTSVPKAEISGHVDAKDLAGPTQLSPKPQRTPPMDGGAATVVSDVRAPPVAGPSAKPSVLKMVLLAILLIFGFVLAYTLVQALAVH